MVLSSTTLQLMSLSTQESALHAAQEPRERLLNAALEGVAEVGWANLTISELVRRARVSKRTFYEHFSTKDECLLALFEAVSSEVLDELEAASQLVAIGGVGSMRVRVIISSCSRTSPKSSARFFSNSLR